MSQQIKKKINELIKLSSVGWDSDIEKLNLKMGKQDTLFNELNELARLGGTLLGKTMNIPMADGYAIYVIDKVNKNTVHVSWIDYCDAWMDARLGHGSNIPKSQVRFFVL